ncbi:MAG: YihY/virulence factor BrkB family protein [Burkholderiaceae bacterium]|nr:YihY/virulence factor BrkB family protein [Burkholderiaceae bacterium]
MNSSERARADPGHGHSAMLDDARATLRAVKEQAANDHLTIVAAGVAFYALLSVFPALTALVSIYGLALDPQQLTHQLSLLSQMLPPQAAGLMREQLHELGDTAQGTLSLSLAGSVLIALWSCSAGVRAVMKALNIAYEIEEGRSLMARVGLSMLLALVAIVGVLVAIAAIVVLPAVGDILRLDPSLQLGLGIVKWPLIGALFWFGLALMYRYGPNHAGARWSWLNWGASVAIVIWLVGSVLFSWYVSNFGSYSKTYGPMAAIVILMLWFLLSAWAVLIGAEINAVLQRRAQRRAENARTIE